MKEFRLSKNDNEHYTSFEEMAKAWKCKPNVMQTNNKEKLELQRENFCKKHLCRSCKQPMSYIGGNQMVCTNENCKGIKNEYKNEETGETRVWYVTSYDLLDEKGSEIANNLFS